MVSRERGGIARAQGPALTASPCMSNDTKPASGITAATIFDVPAGTLLTEQDVVRLTQCAFGLQTLRNWRSQKKGPNHFKFGTTVRYRSDVILAWVEGQEVRHG